MGKDPAVLFYTSDFLTGTTTMTDEEVGMYIRLLCLQHQQYKLSDRDMIFICKKKVKIIWDKFKKDDDGFFYNERMRSECEKRLSYSLSRSENRKGKKIDSKKDKDMINICKTYDKHMENENENENEVGISIEKRQKNQKFEVPTIDQVIAYFTLNGFTKLSAERFYYYYQEGNWIDSKGTKIRNWKQKAQAVWFKEENRIKVEIDESKILPYVRLGGVKE